MLKLLQFLINTNLFISIAAVVFTMESQVQAGIKLSFHPYLFIIFFATIFEYNLHRLITLAYYPKALESPRHQWLKGNKKAFYLLVIFSITGFIISICMAKKEVLLALLPIAIITLFYTLPIYAIKQKLMRLREIPGLKIFLISFVWSAVTVLLPIIQSQDHFDAVHITLMIIERFFFIFAITIPFDIRDMDVDSQGGVKTIPNIYGVKKALYFANLSTCAFIVFSTCHYAYFGMYYLVPACLLSGIITLFCLNSKRLRQSPYYHYGILDGTIIVQAALVFLFYSI